MTDYLNSPVQLIVVYHLYSINQLSSTFMAHDKVYEVPVKGWWFTPEIQLPPAVKLTA